MKKIVALSIISSLGLSSFLANAEMNEKNGFYVTGKIGTSITQISGQEISAVNSHRNEHLSLDNHRKGVFSGGIALGYDFSNKFDLPIRAELDFIARGKSNNKNNLAYNKDPYKATGTLKNEVNLNTLMLNAYYDFENQTSFTPYVSAGLGYAMVKYKRNIDSNLSINGNDVKGSQSKSHTSNNFAWSLGVGVKYAINNNLNLDLSYRYLDAGKAKISENILMPNKVNFDLDSKVKVKTNDIMIGLTYNF